jgi:RNA polymerase sigma-70 factor (ECF subfamily)
MTPALGSTPDAELVRLAQGGRRDAVDALLARHEPRVYRFALRMCTNPDDARDVLQETLLAAFKGLATFRGEAEFSTWLFQVARSFCTKSRRRRVGEPSVHEPLDSTDARAVVDGEDPQRRSEDRELGEVVRAALSALPAHYREVLHLKDIEGLSAEEVAAVIDEQVPAAKSRLHRARMELKRHLEAVLDAPGESGAPCPELEEELAAYAGGDIDQRTCERMEAHMARCPRCRHACDNLKRSVAMCSRVEEGEVPAPIRAAIRQALGVS